MIEGRQRNLCASGRQPFRKQCSICPPLHREVFQATERSDCALRRNIRKLSRTNNSGARSHGLLGIRQEPKAESRKARYPPIACAALATCARYGNRRGVRPRSRVGRSAENSFRFEADRGKDSPKRAFESRTANSSFSRLARECSGPICRKRQPMPTQG
jgi:hypothetical protein